MDVEKLRELVDAHPDVMDVCKRYAGTGAHPFADVFASLPEILARLEKLERVAEAAYVTSEYGCQCDICFGDCGHIELADALRGWRKQR